MNNQSVNAKQTHSFSAGLMLTGLFFLINPSVQILDVLPDFIGYFLIMLSIRPLATVLPAFDEVKDKLWRPIFISLAQLASVFVIVAVRGANTGERSIATVFSFVYFILELIFVLPVFHSLLRAFLSLSERGGVTAAGYVPVRNGGIMRAESLLPLTLVFHGVRAFLSFLPDICFLTFGDGTELGAGLLLYPYYANFLAVAVLITVVFGLFWFVTTVPYFRSLSQNAALSRLIIESGALKESEMQVNKRIYNRMRASFFFLTAAVFLTVDLVLDGISIFPDYLSAGAYFIGFLLLFPFAEKRSLLRIPVIVSLLYGLCSIADYVSSTAFYSQYTEADLGRKRLADQLYRIYMVSSVAKAVSVILLAVLSSIVLYLTFRSLLRRTGEGEDGTLTYSHKALLSEYRVRLIRLSVVGGVLAVFEAANVFLRRITEEVAVDETVLGYGTQVISHFGTFWVVPMIVVFLWTFLSHSLLADFSEEIKKRYGLLE